MDISASGTYTETIKTTSTVMKERSIDRAGTFHFTYDEALDRLLWVKAYIETKGQRTTLKARQIIDKPDQGDSGDISSDRLVTLVYPGVKVGSTMTSTHAIETFVPPMNGVFASNFSFGEGYRELKGASLVVTSTTRPVRCDWRRRLLEHGNPAKWGKITSSPQLCSRTPRVVGEGSDRVFLDSPVPRVWVSTAKGWNQVGDAIGAKFEQEIRKPLPSVLEKIRVEVMAKKGAMSAGQVADLVTSLMNGVMRYHSDTRSANSGYAPRSLASIGQDLYGDCKDFSTVFAAIMRRLGYRAEVAAIYRDSNQWIEPALPTLSEFDHAIVRVQDRSGLIVWVDPTAPVSHARFIDADIPGRPVLVLSAKGSRLERTTVLSAKGTRTESDVEYMIRPDGSAHVETSHRFQGRSAASMVEVVRTLSERDVKEIVTTSVVSVGV